MFAYFALFSFSSQLICAFVPRLFFPLFLPFALRDLSILLSLWIQLTCCRDQVLVSPKARPLLLLSSLCRKQHRHSYAFGGSTTELPLVYHILSPFCLSRPLLPSPSSYMHASSLSLLSQGTSSSCIRHMQPKDNTFPAIPLRQQSYCYNFTHRYYCLCIPFLQNDKPILHPRGWQRA